MVHQAVTLRLNSLSLHRAVTVRVRSFSRSLFCHCPRQRQQPSLHVNIYPRAPNQKGMFQIVPSNINLAVVMTGGPGSSGGALMVATSSVKCQNKYLFNCGEALSRHVIMSKSMRTSNVRLANLKNIFITHNHWKNIGGLQACALTLNNSTKMSMWSSKNQEKKPEGERLFLYGPDGIESSTCMSRKLYDNNHLHIEKCTGEYTDNTLTISPVIFYDNKPRACVKRRRRKMSSSDTESESDEPEALDSAFAYICKPNPELPKILLEKCVEHGVTIGPMVGQLKNGVSVTLEDGRVVHPEMVTVKTDKDNRPFLVVECPTLTFLPSLVANPDLEEFMTSDPQKSFMLIVHMTPLKVYETEQYQAWMKRFSPSTHHMVLNESAWEMDPTKVREHQARLHLVHPQLFPLLNVEERREDAELDLALADSAKETINKGGGENDSFLMAAQGRVVKACPGLIFVYRGKNPGFQVSEEIPFTEEIAKLQEKAEVREALARLKTSLSEENEFTERKRHYPKILFLGTASAETNRIRAQSCILIQLSKKSIMIMDCGEDSYGQLYRFYGNVKAAQVLRKVKAIFVSHMHPDHFMGLFTLIQERKKAFDVKGIPYEPVIIMAPIQFRRWLRFFDEEMEPVLHLVKVLHHQLDQKPTDRMKTEHVTRGEVKEQLSLLEFEPVEVIHCANAYGVTFTHKNGVKVTYSGDTIPCDRLIEAGKDSDILIHEATHEDSLVDLARIAKHSTFSQAIDVGAKMAAKHIILTHFSQRYHYIVPLSGLDLPSNLGIAFDNMMVTPTTLDHLPKVIPVLKSVFEEELENVERRQNKRVQQMEEEAGGKMAKIER